MPGQYQADVIGTPFSGVEPNNGSMTVMACPQFGSRHHSDTNETVEVAAVYSQYDERFDDVRYYTGDTTT